MTGVIKTKKEIVEEINEYLLNGTNENLWEIYIKLFPFKDITLYDTKEPLYKVSQLTIKRTKPQQVRQRLPRGVNN